MRATIFLVAATTLGYVQAQSVRALKNPMANLNRRQAFDPEETTGSGANCVEAFGAGYVECVPETATEPRLCINPGRGQTCCNAQWGCPSDSFCLVQDLCCPTGLDPATCAAQNDVTLPPGFGSSAPTSAPTLPLPTTTAPPLTTTSIAGPSGNLSTSRTATITSKPPVVTAGAAHEHVGVAAAALLGLAAAMAL